MTAIVINVSDRKMLWCKACKEVLNSKKSIVEVHIDSAAHKMALSRFEEQSQASFFNVHPSNT